MCPYAQTTHSDVSLHPFRVPYQILFNTMLAPLLQPGLVLFPGFTAQGSETFFVKCESGFLHNSQYQISFASPIGGADTPFMRMSEEEKKIMVFRSPNGQETIRIVKLVHHWSGKSPEYHDYAPDGRKIWHLTLKEGLLRTKYSRYVLCIPIHTVC